MGIFDIFNSTNPPPVYGSGETGMPGIGDVQADYVNLNNIVSGNAKSADYGAGIGAGIGAFFGAPQQGADIGRTVFPILNQTVRPALSNLWNDIAK